MFSLDIGMFNYSYVNCKIQVANLRPPVELKRKLEQYTLQIFDLLKCLINIGVDTIVNSLAPPVIDCHN